jgi:hypothetical protein
MDCIGYAKKLEKENAELKEMTVPQLLDKIAGEMCDKYCKFPDQAKDEDELFKNHCDKCPMLKLT